MTVDVVAIGAHPDDVELTIGGTVAKLVDRGKRVVIIDMTRGEMGTRGTPERRAEEAQEAARTLGAVERICLDLGDGTVMDTIDSRVKVVEQLRRLRPTIVLANYWEDLHPDHNVCGQIVKNVMYTSGFKNFPAAGEPYRPNEFLFFMGHFPFEPSFVVDVSDYFETKRRAIECYQSQLHDPESDEPITQIARPDFLLRIEARARHFGSQIHTTYGEPLLARRPVPMDDPVEHYRPFDKW